MSLKDLNWPTIKAALKQHYSAPTKTIFARFRLGAACFFTGGIGIWISQKAIEPSILQELVLLAGMLLAATGFFIAMLAQIRLLISRLLQFWWS